MKKLKKKEKKLTSVVEFSAGVSHVELRHDGESKSVQLRKIELFLHVVQGVGQMSLDVGQSLKPLDELLVDELQQGWVLSGQDGWDLDIVQRFDVVVAESVDVVDVDWSTSRLHR